MAKTTEEVDLIVRAIAEGFQQVIDTIENTGDAVEDSGEAAESSSNRWTELQSKLNLAKEAFGGVQKVVDVTIETIKRGAEIQATTQTFDRLAASINTTGDSLRDNLGSATAGMVSDFELMQSANRFMAMGLASTEAEVAELSRTAVQLGSAMGVEAGQAMEDFALLLANQSIPRLDTFGISSGKVRERIGELTTGVNALDKETAFMVATMEQANLTMDKVGDASTTTAASISRLSVHTQNLKDRLSEAFAARWEPIIGGVANTVDVLADKQQRLNEAVESGLISQERADILYNRMFLTFADWGGEAAEVIDNLERLEDKQSAYNDQLAYVEDLMSRAIEPTEQLAEANTNIGFSLDLVSESADRGKAAWENYKAGIAAAAEEQANQIANLEGMLGTIDNVSSIIASGYDATALAAEDSAERQLAADQELASQLKQSAFDVAEARVLAQGGDAIANLESLLQLQESLGLITGEEAEARLTQAENTQKAQEVTQALMDVFLEDGVLARGESERLDEVMQLITEDTELTKEALIAMGADGSAAIEDLNAGVAQTEANLIKASVEAGILKSKIIDGIPDRKVVTIEIRTVGNTGLLEGGDTTSEVMEEGGVS